MALDDVRRERIALPLLRDERPELLVREMARIVAERADLAPDTTGGTPDATIPDRMAGPAVER